MPVIDVITSDIDRQTDKRLADALTEVNLIPSEHRRSPPPNWRWHRAAILRSTGRRPRVKDDDWIKLAMRFLEAKEKCPANTEGVLRLRARFPAVYEAWRIYLTIKDDYVTKPLVQQTIKGDYTNQRWLAEAYLCAAADVDSIAARVREHRDTVIAYSKLFYDVEGKQHQRGYMLNDAIGRSVHYGLADRDYDLLWKLAGFLYGPIFLDCFFTHDGAPTAQTTFEQRDIFCTNRVKYLTYDRGMTAIGTGQIDYNREAILTFFGELLKIERDANKAGEEKSLIHNNIRAMVCNFGFAVAADKSGPAEYTASGIEYRAGYLIERAVGYAVEAPADLPFPSEKAGPLKMVDP